MIFCHALENKLNMNLDVAGSQIVSVDGKGQFPVVTKLFRLINKDVAILTDLDGFIDDNTVVDLFVELPESVLLATSYGCESLSAMVKSVKTSISELLIYNLYDLKEVYEAHPYWINKSKDEDESKCAKRAVIGQLFSMGEENIKEWSNGEKWLNIKKRLEVVFAILRKLGCFVLTKGAIESYYICASCMVYNQKPSAAVDEIANLDGMKIDEISEYYKDIIYSLEYMASTKYIDESYAVKKELLSELALILGILKDGITEKDIKATIKQAKNNAVSLFKYSIINKDGKLGVLVDLQSKIINVNGFPFEAFIGQNVNNIVNEHVKN